MPPMLDAAAIRCRAHGFHMLTLMPDMLLTFAVYARIATALMRERNTHALRECEARSNISLRAACACCGARAAAYARRVRLRRYAEERESDARAR